MSKYLFFANRDYNFDSSTAPNRRPNILSTVDNFNFKTEVLDASIDPNVPVIPQFINYCMAGPDVVIYLASDGKFYSGSDPFKKIADLPAGVPLSAVGYFGFVTSQTITGSTQSFLIMISNFASPTIYYASSAVGQYEFGSWRSVNRQTSAVLGRSLMVKGMDNIGSRMCIFGRFVDENGQHYGAIRNRSDDMDIWEPWDFTKLSTNDFYAKMSYANGIFTSADGDYHMYGCIFNDQGTNILSANVSGGSAELSTPVQMQIQGYDSIASMAETSTGRIAIALEIDQTVFNVPCNSTRDSIRKGLRRTLITWSIEKNNWVNIGPVSDTTGLNALSDFRLFSSNIGYNYKNTCFLLATKCTETTNSVYSIILGVEQNGGISSFIAKKIEFSATKPIYTSTFYSSPSFGVFLINYGLTPPLPKKEDDGGLSFKDPGQALKAALTDKKMWIMAGIGLVFLGIYIYSKIVSNVGKTQRQIAAIAKAYERKANQPPPPAYPGYPYPAYPYPPPMPPMAPPPMAPPAAPSAPPS